MPPTVSVCIPTYNRREYLAETLESVYAQTYKDYEVIVGDDGSTDGTDEMLSQGGYDLRYYRLDHQGQPAARNRLIELATGRFITFLDSDDVLYPDAVERLMAVIDSHGPDVFAYGSHVGIDEHGNVIRARQPKPPAGRIVADLFEFIHVKSCGTMCAKRIYEREGGFDASLVRCAVYKLLLQLSLKYDFVPADGPTYKKRRHRENRADQTFAGRKLELDVLEHFYFQQGGEDVIPRARAMRRLSQEGYRAGRCALNEGLPDKARYLFRQSFSRDRNIKSLYWWMVAVGKRAGGRAAL